MCRVKTSGHTLQSYIISSSLGANIIPEEITEELKEQNKLLANIDKQIRGIATNVNQMAHVGNAFGNLPSVSVLSDIRSHIDKCRKEVNEVWQSTRRLISQPNHTGL